MSGIFPHAEFFLLAMAAGQWVRQYQLIATTENISGPFVKHADTKQSTDYLDWLIQTVSQQTPLNIYPHASYYINLLTFRCHIAIITTKFSF